MPQSKSFVSSQAPDALDRSPSVGSGWTGSEKSSPSFEGSPEETAALASIREMIAASDRLDPMLGIITDMARQLTGASGAALAMWRDGAMVCRARSGDIAPPLGARLNAETGISGQCLQTGRVRLCTDTENNPIVDVEVCRSLGLRSIAVLPIQGWRGTNGILEVFSTKPGAFTNRHIVFLQQLAALAERARATQPHGASPSPAKPVTDAPPSFGLLPASDRVGDVVLASMGRRSRPFILSGISAAALALLGLVIWLGWRGADGPDGRARAATTPVSETSTANSLTAHPPDNDPVWKPNPGGESLFVSSGKPSAGSPVKFASQVDAISPKRTQAGRSHAPLLADLAAQEVRSTAIAGDTVRPGIEATSSLEPPAVSGGGGSNSALSGVISAKATLPGLAAPVSKGVTGGQLVHHIEPVYPAQALTTHLEGTVTLSAMIMEDGSVRDVKVLEGSSLLAQSAVEAVRHWRYTPYELDGKPVKNEVRIHVDFKFPGR